MKLFRKYILDVIICKKLKKKKEKQNPEMMKRRRVNI